MYRDSTARSLVKAVSWRLSGTLTTMVAVLVFTGRAALALEIGGIEFFSKILLFFAHERLWDRVPLGKRARRPFVLWLTGLSGAGKTTLGEAIAARLESRGLRVERLDGDTIRDLFPSTGFSRAERDGHVRRVGYLASRLERNGVVVVASLISPYRDARDFVRGLCREFVEVHVATPLAECERRDPKGLYARARRGEIAEFTGVSAPYEAPERAEVTIDTTGRTIEDAAGEILRELDRRGRAGRGTPFRRRAPRALVSSPA